MVKVDHLGLAPQSAELSIVTGDPQRAAAIARFFGAELMSERRGFDCYVAAGWKRPLAIVATGIGGPAIAIVAEELIALGVRAIVRVGTCGALQNSVHPDDLVISTGCVRDEGTSRAFIEPSFPAVPDSRLTARLACAANAKGARVHAGITHCKDAYYSERLGMQPNAVRERENWQIWRNAGVLATEMECAPLFVLASLRRIIAGGILIVVGKTETAGFARSLEMATLSCGEAFSWLIDEGILDKVKSEQPDLTISYLAHNA